mmetsp:Transcript_2667/g.6349  ORF Transcript_2667/g.6349 Transcript_2667/m.6349 type:complete len:235 (-) Transcript_2667:38-742(-)
MLLVTTLVVLSIFVGMVVDFQIVDVHFVVLIHLVPHFAKLLILRSRHDKLFEGQNSIGVGVLFLPRLIMDTVMGPALLQFFFVQLPIFVKVKLVELLAVRSHLLLSVWVILVLSAVHVVIRDVADSPIKGVVPLLLRNHAVAVRILVGKHFLQLVIRNRGVDLTLHGRKLLKRKFAILVHIVSSKGVLVFSHNFVHTFANVLQNGIRMLVIRRSMLTTSIGSRSFLCRSKSAQK